MVVGAATVILWKQIAVDAYGSKLYEMVPGFLAASGSIVIASLLDRVPVGAVRETHDEVHAALAEHGY
jgi:sodium/proline symporter